MSVRSTTGRHFQYWSKTADEPQLQQPQPRRRGRGLAILLSIPIGAILLLWLAPMIIARTSLVNWAVARALGNPAITVRVGEAKLGWFSAVELGKVVVADAQGRTAAELPRIVGTKSLLGLLFDRSYLGAFRIEQPRIIVSWRIDGSNWEDMIAPWLSESTTAEPIAAEVEIVDGNIEWIDQSSGETRRFDQLSAKCLLSRDRPQLIDLRLEGRTADSTPGRFESQIVMRQLDSGQFNFKADGLPLSLANGPMARLAGRWQMTGTLSGAVSGRWGGDGGSMSAQGDLKTANLDIRNTLTGSERLAFDRLQLMLRAEGRNDRLEIPRAHLECDLGHVTFTGDVNLARWRETGMPEAVLTQEGELSGRLDLAKLTAMLPGTLRLRPQLRIVSGEVELNVRSRRDEQAMLWVARAKTSDIIADDRGRQLRWEQPIDIQLDAHQTPRGPVIDLLECRSDFLRITAAGNFDDLAGNAQFELDKLVAQLEKFVDLTDVRIAGRGWARGRWKRLANDDFDASFHAELRDLTLLWPGGTRLNEPYLAIAAVANGGLGRRNRTAESAVGQIRVDRLDLDVRTAAEQLIARAAAPITDLTGSWPIDFRFNGRLENLLDRIALFIPIDPWQARGTLTCSALGTVSAEGVSIRDFRATVEPFEMLGPGMNIVETKLEIAGNGSWQRKSAMISIPSLTWNAPAGAGRVEQLALSATTDLAAPSGRASFQGDLARISQWFRSPLSDAPRLSGVIVGAAVLTGSPASARFQIDADLNQLALRDRQGILFSEPRVRFNAVGDWDRANSELRIERGELASSTVSAGLAGRCRRATGSAKELPVWTAELSGACNYDLERLTALLQPYLGPNIAFQGRHSSRWTYQGPFNPASARGEAAAPWQSGVIYGFPVGPGELRVRLADGWLVADPCETVVADGRLSIAPRLDLANYEAYLPAGKLLENVQISPDMCERAMKYALPVLAEVTEVRGAFSVELDGARIPLSDPARSDIAGRILIHSVEVAPGPLIRELAILLGRAVPGKLRRESVVPFRMVQGRVYHQGMELEFPDITIRTQGSVGLDQSLALLIEMPPPPKWVEGLANTPAAAALRNQTLRIPLAGTLSRPLLDRKTIDEYNRQFLRNAAANVIDDVLNRQLDRLLNPPRK